MMEIDPILEKQTSDYTEASAGCLSGIGLIFLPIAGLGIIVSVIASVFFGRHDTWEITLLLMVPAYFGHRYIKGMERAQNVPDVPSTFGGARFMSEAYREDELAIIDAYGELTANKASNHFLGFYRMNAHGAMPNRIGRRGVSASAPAAIEYGKPAHLLTVAPSRSGKGTDVIVPNLMRSKGRSFVVVDPKGENAAITSEHRQSLGDVFLLNPFNELKLGTDHFNPLSHLSISHPRVFADCKSLAEALVPRDANPSGNSEYFNSGARGLVQALLLHLLETKGRAATLTDIRPILTSKAALDRALFEMTEKSGFRPLRELAGKFVKETKSVDEIISTAQVKTDFLSEPAFETCLSKSDFEFIDLKGKPTTVYVILPSRYLETYSAFMRLMMVAALDELQTAEGGDVPTTFILDEFSALGYLSHFEDAIGKVAGYGVQLWPFVQDLNQLRSIYETRWESFIANAGVVQWFAPQDQFTQEYLSKRLGHKTVVTRSKSSSKGTSQKAQTLWQKNPFSPSVTESENESWNEGEAGQPLMAPSELAGLKRNLQIITFAGYSFPLKAARFPYYIGEDGILALGLEEDFAMVVTSIYSFADIQPNPYFKGRRSNDI